MRLHSSCQTQQSREGLERNRDHRPFFKNNVYVEKSGADQCPHWSKGSRTGSARVSVASWLGHGLERPDHRSSLAQGLLEG